MLDCSTSQHSDKNIQTDDTPILHVEEMQTQSIENSANTMTAAQGIKFFN